MVPLLILVSAAAATADGGGVEALAPWLGVGAAWGLVVLFVTMVFRGDLGTKREMNSRDKEIEYLREANAMQAQTISDFTGAIDTSTAMIKAVLDVAQRGMPS